MFIEWVLKVLMGKTCHVSYFKYTGEFRILLLPLQEWKLHILCHGLPPTAILIHWREIDQESLKSPFGKKKRKKVTRIDAPCCHPPTRQCFLLFLFFVFCSEMSWITGVCNGLITSLHGDGEITWQKSNHIIIKPSLSQSICREQNAEFVPHLNWWLKCAYCWVWV